MAITRDPVALAIMGVLFYASLLALTVVLFGPMLFIPAKRSLSKKVLGTVLLSLPCLLVTAFFFIWLFMLPAVGLLYAISEMNDPYDPPVFLMVLIVFLFLAYVLVVVITGIYLWYLSSLLLFQRIDRKPYADVLNNDKILQWAKPRISWLSVFPINRMYAVLMRTEKLPGTTGNDRWDRL